MVYAVDPEAIAAMEQTHGPDEYVVTAFYGADTTVPNADYPDGVPVSSQGSITCDASSQVQSNGSLYLAEAGASLVPKGFTDPLAPFGQELTIVRRVRFASASWDVPLGRFRIQDVPDMSELYPGWPLQQKQFGWQAQLTVCDRFDILQADDFLATTTPVAGNSTWDEIQRLSDIPVVVSSVPDASVPASLVYQGRLDALTQLASNIGGELAINRDGALTVRPANNWLTATVTVATVKGTVTVSGGMSNDIVNSVSVTNPNNAVILGVAEITDPSNPLCVTGPLGRRTQVLSDPLMDTQAKATAAAQTALARLSSQQSRTVTVTCLPRPDLDLGDFIEVDDQASPNVYKGEIRQMEHQLDPSALMSFQLTVAEVSQ